jgi:hypothetical protein
MTDSNPTREELEEMDEEELKRLATSRGITVTARDGSDKPSVDDYIGHLASPDESFGGDEEQDDDIAEGDAKAEAAQRRSAQPHKKLDETVSGGRYINAAGKTVNAEGKEVGGDGKAIKAEDVKFPDSPE